MITSPDFSGPARYRNSSIGETAREAARIASRTAPKQWERVYLALLGAGVPMTPEQITTALNVAGVRVMLMSVRPRCSELVRLGLIEDSGLRGIGAGGYKTIKWQIVKVVE